MGYKHVELAEKPTEAQFWAFVKERQTIWHKRTRLKQPPPWTDDSFLRRMKFCNVYRVLDRGTLWPIENIYSKMESHAYLLFSAIAYRCCNNPETFEDLAVGFPKLHNWKEVHVRMLQRQKNGFRIFGTAYRASAFGPTPRLEIYRNILLCAQENMTSMLTGLQEAKSLKEAHKIVISHLWGVGPFIAFEVLNDLLYTPFFKGQFSANDWVFVGPGAAYALKNFWNIHHQKYQLEEIRRLWSEQEDKLGSDFPWLSRVGDIPLADIEGCLCEFRKYITLQNGGGRVRKFVPLEDYGRLYESASICISSS